MNQALVSCAELSKAADALSALLAAVCRVQAEQPQRKLISPAASYEVDRLICALSLAAQSEGVAA